MQSTLIRFIDSQYADSYLRGELYLSSLSKFWNYMEGKVPCGVDVTDAETVNNLINTPQDRQDFSEGVVAQIPRDKVSQYFGPMRDHIVHDVRFRLSAYKYCNLLCFFRIDAEEEGSGLLDEENVAYVLQNKGYTVTADQIRDMEPAKAQRLVAGCVEKNPVLSSFKTHSVQLPTREMDRFGDAVVVIKDQKEFERRIITAVQRDGGHVILGDIRYHHMLDRVDPSTVHRHSMTIISSGHHAKNRDEISFTKDGIFHISLLDGIEGIYWRGPLDKFDLYAHQKEWRVCWLPYLRNYEAKVLSVGPLDDVIDIVATENIRSYLLKRYKGYYPGIVKSIRKYTCGTESYRDFKNYMKTIDGLGDFIAEIG